MNMLIIGNGFDLAHGRPTKYEDFLKFAESIMRIQSFAGSDAEFQTSLSGLKEEVKEYVLNLRKDTEISQINGQVHSHNKILREIWDCLNENIWYKYFQMLIEKDKMRGKGWIDFESEVLLIIKFFDERFQDLYNEFSIQTQEIRNFELKIRIFYSKLTFSKYNTKKGREPDCKVNCSDFIEKTYQDLEKLIRCLEIYLDDCVAKIPITCCSPDIKGLECGSVLSFNYTEIPAKIYPSLTNTHYIHGFAEVKRPAAENNMVLGVNEYWDGDDKNTHTNFNLYKKFVQRIIKETGIGYKSTLAHMLSTYEESEQRYAQSSGYIGRMNSNVYIFGHSLDVTDGDILREVIRNPGVITTIF